MKTEEINKSLLSLADAITQLAEAIESSKTTGQRLETVAHTGTPEHPPAPEEKAPETDDFDFENSEPETSELDFESVSTEYFDTLDFIADHTTDAKAQSAATKLLKKHTEGKPINKGTLPPEKFEAFLADVRKCRKIVEDKING